MTMGKLIKIVDKVYPDGLVGQYYKWPLDNHGDLLAKFIAHELSETYDPKASEAAQIQEACRVMDRASDQLRTVANELWRRRHKLTAKARKAYENAKVR